MPASSAPAASPGRQTVLRASLAGLGATTVLTTTGCRLRVGSAPTARPVVPTQPTPDELALDRAASLAGGLAALYARAALTRPDLAPALAQLAGDHSAHLQAVQALRPTSANASSGSSTPSPTDSPAPGLPFTAATLLSALGQAERTATAAVLADLTTTGPEAARLLASIAACGSSHVTLLARLPAPAKARKAAS